MRRRERGNVARNILRSIVSLKRHRLNRALPDSTLVLPTFHFVSLVLPPGIPLHMNHSRKGHHRIECGQVRGGGRKVMAVINCFPDGCRSDFFSRGTCTTGRNVRRLSRARSKWVGEGAIVRPCAIIFIRSGDESDWSVNITDHSGGRHRFTRIFDRLTEYVTEFVLELRIR